MKPYVERQVFEPHVLRLWKRATELVSMLPTWWRRDPADGSWQAVRTDAGAKELRCHEVARAIGRRLVLGVRDGQYGIAEHSWLEIPGSPFVILDTYACGRMPQVQLVDQHVALPELKAYVVVEDRKPWAPTTASSTTPGASTSRCRACAMAATKRTRCTTAPTR